MPHPRQGGAGLPGLTRTGEPAIPHPTRRLLLLSVAALGGCKLIDQRSFAPTPAAPAPSSLASLPPLAGRVALLTVRYSTPDPPYGEALRTAVRAAEERRPGTGYDVVAAVPTAADPASQFRELGRARQNAAAVMRAMMALGVPDTRIALGAETAPGLAAREVRVFLR